ncbi:MAG: alpha/beta hydrolase [Pseudomonadota bacterium]|nr:alpha/beta hydrolase [Pseudomonadota bacterium]
MKKQFPKIHSTKGGEGETTFLLLHGLGATGDVWHGVASLIDEKNLGQWIIPDLRGHGRSEWGNSYGLGEHANDMLKLIYKKKRVIIVGHSMGGLIGLALATGWFGMQITGVIAIGTIINWNEENTQKSAELAQKPVRWFKKRAEAIERFLKIAGLDGLISPRSKRAMSGIVEEKHRFRLAADNAVGTIGGPWMKIFLDTADCPMLLATGENDPIVPSRDYLNENPNSVIIPNVAHNAHVENPSSILSLIKKLEEKLS